MTHVFGVSRPSRSVARVSVSLSAPARGLVAALPVSLRGVGRRFPRADGGSRTVLRDIDLEIPAGRRVAVVGETGSGKSTIAKLLTRLMDPTEGAVLLDGVDVRSISQESLRRSVVLVPQEGFLFDDTVAANVRYGRLDATDEEIVAAADAIGLGDWLAGLPDGLDTELGGVSAGEAQLLALARAALADPGLVVLDEASSRLDPATERRISDSVDRLLTNRTGVLIAHRLSSLSRVDKIAVIADGRIIEYGFRTDLAADPDSRFSAMLTTAGVTR